MSCRSLTVLIALVLAGGSMAVAARIQTGPMVGYVTMAEVLLWLQTDAPAEVSFEYWPVGQEDAKARTAAVTTERASAFVAKCVADQVKAGTEYEYRVLIDGKPQQVRFRPEFQGGSVIPLRFKTPPNWRFRERGHEVPDFKIALGSCAYINEAGGYDRLNSRPYGNRYEIFEAIYTKYPDLFIWLGDNVYLRETDWTSRTGFYHRWTHDRSIPEMRGLLATVPQYGIWDDHDYGPNDAGREFWNKEMAKEAFLLFHGNPSAGLPELPGIFTFFNYGDVNVYLLDNRSYRTQPHLNSDSFGIEKALLGKKQIDWLVESMSFRQSQTKPQGSSYPSNFNLICIGSQVLSPFSKHGYAHYPEEYQYLIDRIVDAEIDGVVFLTGDVHFSEMSRLVYKGGGQPGVLGRAGIAGEEYYFHEVTSSPLTSGPWAGAAAELNPYRLDVFDGEADRVGRRNFAVLEFSGDLSDRLLTVKFYDPDGNLLNRREGGAEDEVTKESVFRAVDLRAPANR